MVLNTNQIKKGEFNAENRIFQNISREQGRVC